MPRFAPDGSVNAIHFQRLKDKLGNRSNASSEVEFDGAYAMRVGDEGKGIRTIIQMVQLTRQDCAIASAGLMRSGLAHALHHARHRSVFQKHLADQPLMQAVLSDMALHVEASIALVMRLCRSFDRAPDDAGEAAYHAAADARDQILGLQERAGISLRGDGVPGRQRLCRGGHSGAALPRIAGQCDLGRLGQCHVPGCAAGIVARGRRRRRRFCRTLPSEASGLPGAAEAVAFIGKAFRRPDSERVARLAVEKLALLAAAAALNAGVAASRRIVRADTACPESRQHVWRGRSRQRRHQGPAGAGAALISPSRCELSRHGQARSLASTSLAAMTIKIESR